MGKTALALAVVHDSEVRRRFPDGILWAGLGPEPNVLGLLGAWGAALGLAPQELARLSREEDRARAIRSVVANRRMLLVVDDVWEAEDGLCFLVGGPNCAFLATTRFPAVAVHVARDEFVVVPELSEEEGVALLEHLAPAVAGTVPDDVRDLVRSVDGLPLALTLMGKYLRAQAYGGQPRRVHQAVERLRHTTDRLRLTLPVAPGERPPSLRSSAHLSLESVIAVSDNLLDDAAREALRALAVFPPKPNSFAEDAALVVSMASEETLDALTDAGLLEGSGPGRYTLHRTVADYARHALTDEKPYERLVRYFIPFVEEHTNDYAALDLECRNVLRALDVAAGRGFEREVVHGAVALAPFLASRGLYDDAETHLRRAERIVRAAGDGAGLTRVAMHLGRVAQLQGDAARANALYAEGLDAARRIGDREGACALLTYWGEAMVMADDDARAEVYVREGLALARELGQWQRMGVLLRLLGEIADSHGDYAQGEAFSLEGLKAAREAGDWETVCALLQNLGVKAERYGQYARAEELYAEGLKVAGERGYRQRTSALLMNAGMLALRRKRYPEADALHQESLVQARVISDRKRISAVLQNMGLIAAAQGRFGEAEERLRESLEMARALRHRWLVSETLCAWGEVLLQQRREDEAQPRFEEALAIADELQGAELRAQALYGLARIGQARGDLVCARRLGEESLRTYENMGHERGREVAQWVAGLGPA